MRKNEEIAPRSQQNAGRKSEKVKNPPRAANKVWVGNAKK
jgi:hypothetical protein